MSEERKEKILDWYKEGFNDYIYEEVENVTKEDILCELIKEFEKNKELKENYDRIYNENCKLREEHNITDISLLDENQQLKKQKNDVVEYIKGLEGDYDLELANCVKYKIFRMLGEIE